MANYIDNKKLSREVSEYSRLVRQAIAEKKDIPDFPETITKDVWKIIKEYSKRPNYCGYKMVELLDDMQQDAFINIFNLLRRGSYDPEHNNAFSYFTECIKTEFKKTIGKDKKESRKKYIHMLAHDAVSGDMTSEAAAQMTEFTKNMDPDIFEKPMKRLRQINEKIKKRNDREMEEFRDMIFNRKYVPFDLDKKMKEIKYQGAVYTNVSIRELGKRLKVAHYKIVFDLPKEVTERNLRMKHCKNTSRKFIKDIEYNGVIYKDTTQKKLAKRLGVSTEHIRLNKVPAYTRMKRDITYQGKVYKNTTKHALAKQLGVHERHIKNDIVPLKNKRPCEES